MKRACRVILMSSFLFPLEAHADDSLDPLADFADPEAPRKLLAAGRSLMRSGKYTDACTKLEESIRLDANIGAQFELADCNEHIGKVASAWVGFRGVATPKALERAHALEKKLPKLTIEVPNASPDLEIRRDGVVIARAEWGTPVAVDPGQHRVTARVPGRTRWLSIVDSSEGDTTRVEIPREFGATPEDDKASEASETSMALSYAATLAAALGAAPVGGGLVMFFVAPTSAEVRRSSPRIEEAITIAQRSDVFDSPY